MLNLIIDTANTFTRARHAAHRGSSLEERVAFATHVTLASVHAAWRDQKANHVVFCFEGRSWRKDVYPPYKKNRSVARAASSIAEQEEDQLFWDTLEKLQNFIVNKTNCTTLQHSELEADDLIAGWVQNHPNDTHVIVSSDTDYYQLLSNTVKQYNGITCELHTINGIFDKKGKLVIDKKTKLPKTVPDPGWMLFEKCMRGDSSDNVFSAYPGVRTVGSKNKIGLKEAYADIGRQGFAWNNLMLQQWVDHEGKTHRVLDDYERNRTLIDLTAQPTHIKKLINDTILAGQEIKNNPMIGAQFLKFCSKYQLVKLSDNANAFANMLSAAYPGKS